MIELGNNITLIGFKTLEPAKLVVVKKVVGNYAKKINEVIGPFNKLILHLKEIHKTAEANQKYEIQGKLELTSKQYNSEVTDYNLFFAIDKALSTIAGKAKKDKR